MHVKQTDDYFKENGYNAIVTDGCFFRSLLHCAEFFTMKELTATEIAKSWHYAIPDYMEDHRTPGKDRCYITAGGHVQIIRIGFYILGERDVIIEYKYRQDINTDGDKRMIIGVENNFYESNFFIGKCKMPSFNHFYVSDMRGDELWNPGQSFSDELLSLRGFRIKVQ